MSALRTIRKDRVTHVALERRSGYVLLCQPDGLPGQVGVFGWSGDAWSFVLSPGSCSACADALSAEATESGWRASSETSAARLRAVPDRGNG